MQTECKPPGLSAHRLQLEPRLGLTVTSMEPNIIPYPYSQLHLCYDRRLGWRFIISITMSPHGVQTFGVSLLAP
jgi:hypothetical protein